MKADDAAPVRFAILSAVRVLAALMIAAGLIVAFGDNQWLSEDIRVPVGLLVVAIGVVDLLWLVPMLARRWRSPQ